MWSSKHNPCLRISYDELGLELFGSWGSKGEAVELNKVSSMQECPTANEVEQEASWVKRKRREILCEAAAGTAKS